MLDPDVIPHNISLTHQTLWLKLMAIKAICEDKFEEAEKYINRLKANKAIWEKLEELNED